MGKTIVKNSFLNYLTELYPNKGEAIFQVKECKKSFIKVTIFLSEQKEGH